MIRNLFEEFRSKGAKEKYIDTFVTREKLIFQ